MGAALAVAAAFTGEIYLAKFDFESWRQWACKVSLNPPSACLYYLCRPLSTNAHGLVASLARQ